MSNTRGVRKVPPVSQGSSGSQIPAPQGPVPSQSTASPLPATGATSTTRGATSATLPERPAPTTVPSTSPPLEKTVDQVNAYRLQGASLDGGALSVRLKSDEEGVTQAQRDAHIAKIQGLCQPYTTGSGTLYAGIETKLETLFSAYIGNFHPDVVKEIKASKEVKRVTQNQKATPCSIILNQCWSTSRVTLSDADFAKLNTKGNKKWQFDDTNMGRLGEGVTIYVVDTDGFYCNDFEENSDRILYTEGGNNEGHSGTQTSHATCVANVAAGKALGIAPKAKIAVYSPEDLTWNDILVVWERLARVKQDGYAILNMSWGFEKTASSGHDLADALQKLIKANFIPIVAAGNDGRYVDNMTSDYYFPQNAKGVIVVGNSDKGNKLVDHSNYGPIVDVYAPGVDIPIIGDTTTLISGTSFSAPLVAGFLANLLSTEDPKKQFSVEDIRSILRKSYSRETDHYKDKKGQQQPVRTITAFLQEKVQTSPQPVPEFIAPENRILKVSIVETGYTVLVPLDDKPHFTDQKVMNSLVNALGRKDVQIYGMILRNMFSSKANPQNSFNAIEQLRVEYGGDSQAQNANSILDKLASLIKQKDTPRTSINCALKLVV